MKTFLLMLGSLALSASAAHATSYLPPNQPNKPINSTPAVPTKQEPVGTKHVGKVTKQQCVLPVPVGKRANEPIATKPLANQPNRPGVIVSKKGGQGTTRVGGLINTGTQQQGNGRQQGNGGQGQQRTGQPVNTAPLQ